MHKRNNTCVCTVENGYVPSSRRTPVYWMELIKRSFHPLPDSAGVFTRWALRIGLQAPRERRSRRLFPSPSHPRTATPCFPHTPLSPLTVAALHASRRRGISRPSRRISANTANEYLEILSFGLVDREREPRRLESGNFKREGQSFAEQVDAEIVHCGYRITRDIVPRLRFLPRRRR